MDDAGTRTDTGAESDAGLDTGPERMVPEACMSPRQVELAFGEMTLTGDTTDFPSDIELSDGCGVVAAPQEVLELTLPGSGEVGVILDLAVDGTSTMFNTIIELRPVACESPADAVCFDDTGSGERRSYAAFVAEGGSTIHAIVTGANAVASGPWTMLATVQEEVSAPVLASAEAFLEGELLDITLHGMDAEGDVVGFEAIFLDEMGEPIVLETSEIISLGFENEVFGSTTFDGEMTIGLPPASPLFSAPELRVRLIDQFRLESETVMVDIRRGTYVSFGDPCDETHVCNRALECTAMTCALPAPTAALCDAATYLSMTPGATATTESFTVTIEPGEGVIQGSCAMTRSREGLRKVTIPPDTTYDLIARTDVEGNATTLDTVLHIQAECGDPDSEEIAGSDATLCHDDLTDTDKRSTVTARNLGAGTYTVVVETYRPTETATDVDVEVTLRPVLPTGATCDRAAELNRCASGSCPAMGEPLCP